MAWAPDGQSLFYTSKRSSQNVYKRSLSSNSDELFSSAAGDQTVLRFSPDGSRICVLSETSGKQLTFSIVDPIRGRLEESAKVDTRDEGTWWALSPDGSKIALVENVSDSVRILDLQSKRTEVIHPQPILDLQGRPIELTHPTPSQVGLQVPAWSADGYRLFISAFPNATKGTLLEMDLAGRTQILLENPYGWIGFPVACPDGKRLAYLYNVQESNVTLLEHF